MITTGNFSSLQRIHIPESSKYLSVFLQVNYVLKYVSSKSASLQMPATQIILSTSFFRTNFVYLDERPVTDLFDTIKKLPPLILGQQIGFTQLTGE